ncbi:MAG: CRISPR-associated helicase Cas3' [Lachnospiraceae bacterium]|nr:CRISPR-associated helicase Cas3' [Lachnospiraceae bacterium]
MDNKKIAHINIQKEQTIKEHLENVAKLAAGFCEDYKIENLDAQDYAYQTGLVHDIGKYSSAFQQKIRGRHEIMTDHSTAGAREMQKLRMPAGAFAVAGHHGGLPNGWDTTNSNLLKRIKNREIEPYSCYENEINIKKVTEPALEPFEEGFFTRMLFSALVDGDFLDTEAFMAQGNIDRGNYETIGMLYQKVLEYIKPWRAITGQTPGINKIRTEILEQCLSEGKGKRGCYSLTVPTGGGKTISSLAFALQHAVQNNMKRIIYVIPYTSIIEQNVQVFQNILGKENVLAHYCTALLESGKQDDGIDDEVYGKIYEKHKLSIENWDAPVIVTTNVQFFESLYSNKVSKCRKLHNIANSVIIFDEVQMIPLHVMLPCVKAVQMLLKSYQASVVLCTATQPAIEKWLKPYFVKEICHNHIEIFNKLKRTEIKESGDVTEQDLLQRINAYRQVLVIVNTKAEAHKLYDMSEEEGRFHLSTYMTPSDRKKTLDIIRRKLAQGETCRVISTSLVEAGVDIDFPVVFREKAGLDSIIQAAGRCNREGRRNPEESIVWVFTLGKIPRMLGKNVAITGETFDKYGVYDGLEPVKYYFETLQSLDINLLDTNNIVESFDKGLNNIKMPFKEIAEVFHMIESDTRMLIIPIDKEACQLVEKLQYKIDNQESFKNIIRELGVYSVNLYENEYKNMLQDGNSYEILDGIAVLQNLCMYSGDKGLVYEKADGAMII